jgi:hypothetical protein
MRKRDEGERFSEIGHLDDEEEKEMRKRVSRTRG